MKKKLLSILLGLSCTLACAFSVAACGVGGENEQSGGNVKAITASSCVFKEQPRNIALSGWELTDTEDSEPIEHNCIDIYIYVAKVQQYGSVSLQNTDFTANGVSPVSFREVGDECTLNSGNFKEYIAEQQPYLSKSATQVTGNENEGYVKVSGNSYKKLVGTSISRNANLIQRYVLEFEQPVVAATIKYNGDKVKKLDTYDSFPSDTYTVASSSALQMFVTDNTSYKVTYKTTTQNYKTAIDREYPYKELILDLKNVEFNNIYKEYSVKCDKFSIEVDGQKYQAEKFYNGVDTSDTRPVNANDVILTVDEFKNKDLTYISAKQERWSFTTIAYCNQASGTNDFSLIFKDLKTKPTEFKVFFDSYQIAVL